MSIHSKYMLCTHRTYTDLMRYMKKNTKRKQQVGDLPYTSLIHIQNYSLQERKQFIDTMITESGLDMAQILRITENIGIIEVVYVNGFIDCIHWRVYLTKDIIPFKERYDKIDNAFSY